ncbi:hypothetical protein ACFQX6_06405 [Streptosporangium lutulentum]
MNDGGTRSGTGHFIDTETRQAFDIAYERAMSLWPPQHDRFDIETRFGTTRVYRYGVDQGSRSFCCTATAPTPPPGTARSRRSARGIPSTRSTSSTTPAAACSACR